MSAAGLSKESFSADATVPPLGLAGKFGGYVSPWPSKIIVHPTLYRN